MTFGPIAPQPVIWGSRTAMNAVEKQSSREFASTDPTTRTQDARVQETGLSPAISIDPCSCLQHLLRPTPPRISRHAPRLSRHGDEHLARGSRGRLKICKTQAFRVLRATT